ncbi:hypothetical protein MNBD_GAMMA10-2204 [hydrothermal vent metagenome]|uniref:PhoD-like phosphatase metallophosphatase domain-containing protein n=1 Tax=hydrothermal vent metagenome TaxID=652676 RepID=A0A3B0Y0A6_9ZZZZ
MIRATIVLREFMDGNGVENADVQFTLTIVPRTMERFDGSPGGGGINMRDFDGFDPRIGGRTPGPLKPELLLRPRMELAETIVLSDRSGEDGIARANFQADAAFQRVSALRINAEPPTDVVGVLGVRVSSGGITSQVNFYSGILDEEGPDLLSSNDTITRQLAIDYAKSIVGETTTNSSTLWFNLHGDILAGRRYVCEVVRMDPPTTAPVTTLPVVFDQNRANTAVVTVTDLDAGAAYRYELYLRPANNETPGTGDILAQGDFKTHKASADELSFVFGSCHLPGSSNSFERWQHLARRSDYDFMLLIGDQIYGDNIESLGSGNNWLERYENRYHQSWTYWPIREVMRRTPVYMILDDHEITDDFGTVPIDADRIAAGMKMYHLFQESHGPARAENNTHYYSFNRGPASFFMLDDRTQRSIPPGDSAFPVLGGEQVQALVDWSQDPATRDADIIFLVAPVPIAWLPVEKLLELINDFESSAGNVAGAVGFAFGGPVGAILGHYIGHEVAEGQLDDEGLGNLTDRDLADMWTLKENQPDMVRVLDILFDLANDIQTDGTRGPRPRAVFVLGGDVHSGAMHVIRSTRTGGGEHDHRKNPCLMQITSSAISQEPASDKLYAKILAGINSGVEVGAWDLIANTFDTEDIIDDIFDGERAVFKLDDQQGGNYISEFSDLLTQRNFGRFHIERIRQDRRLYRFHVSVEGSDDALVQYFDIDLDAPNEAGTITEIKPKSLIGQVLTAEGRLSLLRVHEIGSGFGPSTDKLDTEVIAQLEPRPGESFGFQLRKGDNEKTHRKMLDVLRSAFNNDHTVRLEYERTGRTTGRILRALIIT